MTTLIRTSIFILFIAYTISTSAQTPGYEVNYYDAATEEAKQVKELGDKLVELAFMYQPNHAIKEEKALIAKEQVKLAKSSWLDQLSISANLNESFINPPPKDVATNVYYPKYNVGIRVPLGIFVSQPTQTKIAQKEYRISMFEVESSSAELRRNVLTAYNLYLTTKKLYDIKFETSEESRTILTTMEDKFANGEVDLTEYNKVSKAYKQDVEKLLTAKLELDNAELELEMWIGMELEDVKTTE